jgi:hypothetical protein
MIGRLFRILESRPADQRIEFDLYTKQETAAWLVGSSSGKADAVVREGLMNRYGPYTNGPLQALKGDGSDRRTAFLIAKYHEYCLFEKSKGVVGFRRSVYTPLSYEEPKRGRK